MTVEANLYNLSLREFAVRQIRGKMSVATAQAVIWTSHRRSQSPNFKRQICFLQIYKFKNFKKQIPKFHKKQKTSTKSKQNSKFAVTNLHTFFGYKI